MANYKVDLTEKKAWLKQKLRFFPIFFMVFMVVVISVFPAMAAKPLKVSVLDFSGNVADDLRRTAVNRLTKILIDVGRFELVERAEIDKILKEQHLQSTGLIDQSMAVEIGKVLAVDIAFIGNIDQMTVKYDNRLKSFEARTEVTIKIIDVQSGKIIHMIESSGYGLDEDFNSAQVKAIESCFSLFLIGEIRYAFSISATVIRVRDNYVYFLNGEDIGVRKGSRFKVYQTDNEDLNDLGLNSNDTFKIQVGVIEVVDIAENLAKAKVIWNSRPIKEGDSLKEIPFIIRPSFNLGTSIMKVVLKDKMGLTYEGQAYILEVKTGIERPLTKGTNLLGSFVVIDNTVGVVNLGIETRREMPLFKGRFYLTGSGAIGLSVAYQRFSSPFEIGDSLSTSWFANGFFGFRYYFNRDQGVSFEAGLNAQYGPYFTSWAEDHKDYLGPDVTEYVAYPEIYFKGSGIRLGFNFPINLEQIFY